MTDTPPDDTRYSHRFHAGNVGDVWKHCVWASVLHHVVASAQRVSVIETHAGEGIYKLGTTGEWLEGVGKVFAKPAVAAEPVALHRYRRLLADFPAALYPGSPLITLALLRPTDAAVFYELDAEAHGALRRRLAKNAIATAIAGDGLAALARLKAPGRDAASVVFMDPPYTAKEDWTRIPKVFAETYHRDPKATLVLWYPVKSYTRPNAMLAGLAEAGVPAATVELITTPLKLQRNRLNGSGMLLVNAPAAALSEALAVAPALGALCASHEGHWTTRAMQVSKSAF